MVDGIKIRILGDYGPFSRIGKSVGYEVTIGQASYLIDCGAPLFQQFGGEGLKKIRGLIMTHCHDDHKRWFTDLALFNRYAPDIPHKVFLIASEVVHDELVIASGPALGRSLSPDSKAVVDIAYQDYVDSRVLGPLAKYRIVSSYEGAGNMRLSVTDRSGNFASPEKAKIIISPKTKRPRLLFKDPVYKEWVEPESFYPFSSEVFYEKEQNIYSDSEGFTLEALKSPVWHGVPGIGLRIKTAKETLVLSSDTVHDKHLWEQLYSEKLAQRLAMSRQEFESSPVIYGDINDYIERTWSKERYLEALGSFDDAVVIHDIAVRDSVVHTDYRKLRNTVLNKDKVILCHGPDKLVSEWVLTRAEKNYMIKGASFFEMVGDEQYKLNADIYYKKGSQYFVGYRNDKGAYCVSEENSLLNIHESGSQDGGRPLYKVDLYEDLAGRYFPKLEKDNAEYQERKDGVIELVEFTDKGSIGSVVENHRPRLCRADPSPAVLNKV